MPTDFEKRGVTLDVFRRVRDHCLLQHNEAAGYWAIGRVSALVIGNHEILAAGSRWEVEGNGIDASSTLTFAGKCSLVDMCQQGRFEAHDAPLGGNLRYDEVVGTRANIFVSFAYACDFVELVDALECFFERTPSLDKNSTYFWFDLFVNDQWAALDHDFTWWATTFKEAVEEIGHTLVIMLPWQAPIPLTRVWCLFEISCSQKISIALSSKQVKDFQQTLRSQGGMESVTSSLCKIDVEKATSFLPEDKQRIFAVVEASEGGFHALNVDVSEKMRNWVQESTRELILDSSSSASTSSKEEENLASFSNYDKIARVCAEHGQHADSEAMYTKALSGFMKLLGPHHPTTLSTMNNLALMSRELGSFEKAEGLFNYSLDQYKLLGDLDGVYNVTNNLGTLYKQQAKYDKAEECLSKALEGKMRFLGKDAPSTLNTLSNLAGLNYELQKFALAEEQWLRCLEGFTSAYGENHTSCCNTQNNLGAVFHAQGNYERAREMWTKSLLGKERALGVGHPGTLSPLSGLAALHYFQKDYGQAILLWQKALKGYEIALGVDHPSTLQCVLNLGNANVEIEHLSEAEELFLRASTGFTLAYGPEHPHAKAATKSLAAIRNREVNAAAAAAWPCELEVTCHEHVLKKGRCPYQACYTCDICHKHGTQYSWCFRCDACGYDAHFECASIFTITKILITTSASSPRPAQEGHGPEVTLAATPPPLPAATPPPLPATAERYASQNQQLIGMGFVDEAANLLVLEATNGHVDQSIELLLQ